MLVSFIRYLKGFVVFRATGKSPERFMNICAQRGINLWNARPEGGGIGGRMSATDYKNILPVARKAGVRTRVIQKRGFPFFAARYKGRIGIPIGAAAGIILLIVLSNFIWTINISGAIHVSERRLKDLLAESGVRLGAYKHAIDTDRAKRDILLKTEELGWLSVNISGSHAEVEVREKIAKPEIEDTSVPCNIKASEDGVITKITAENGTARAKVGSGVAKGDLLVSGVSATKQDEVLYVRARGEVYADVFSKTELKIPKSYRYFSLSENKSMRRRLSFLGFSLPCSLSFRSFDRSVYTASDSFLSLNGVSLPLGLLTETEYALDGITVSADRERAEKQFRASLLLGEVFGRGEGVVKERTVTITDGGDNYICTADYVFNENIAESVDFTAEE